MSEADIQASIRLLLASEPNVLMWRNNNGALKDKDGRVVRYGLGADPRGGIGSSDLIGPVTIIITPDMVGHRVAVFTAIEVKAAGATTEPERLARQTRFIATIKAAGGFAGFATSIEEARDIINGKL